MINDRLTQFTEQYEPRAVMDLLQARGVPAGMVQRSSDHLQDPQLAHRDFFRRMQHPEMGEVPYEGHQYRIAGYSNGPRMAAPCLGEHTYEVLTEGPRPGCGQGHGDSGQRRMWLTATASRDHRSVGQTGPCYEPDATRQDFTRTRHPCTTSGQRAVSLPLHQGQQVGVSLVCRWSRPAVAKTLLWPQPHPLKKLYLGRTADRQHAANLGNSWESRWVIAAVIFVLSLAGGYAPRALVRQALK